MEKIKKKFIEIGTCDFRTLRYLCDQGWEGVMVEPYAPFLDNIPTHENLTKVCVAIGPENTITDYIKVKDDVLEISELDYRGMGSIHPENVLFTYQGYKDITEIHKVAVITFDDLIRVSDFDSTIDFLKLDTEGMDFEILKSIDLQKYNIKVILSEVREVWEEDLKQYLEDNGYLVQILHNDLFAVKLNLLED